VVECPHRKCDTFPHRDVPQVRCGAQGVTAGTLTPAGQIVVRMIDGRCRGDQKKLARREEKI
jgi:hypothetical protein